MGLELCNGAGGRALLWELLHLLFGWIARGIDMLDSLFFGGWSGLCFCWLVANCAYIRNGVKGAGYWFWVNF